MRRAGNLGPTRRRLGVIHVLQLSDPHLLADPQGRCRGRQALACLHQGWTAALRQLQAPPDWLLISGDLCQDESLGGYVRLRQWLEQAVLPLGVAVALLPGNHDHPGLLRCALGRTAALAPGGLSLPGWGLLLLNSHRPGAVEGWLEPRQLAWLDRQLAVAGPPLLVALHHPPLAIGSPELDAIGLRQGPELLDRLLTSPRVRGLVCGHVHQHWQALVPRPGGGDPLPLWSCPSTLASFTAVQPCPLRQADHPGGRLLRLGAEGEITTELLRWLPGPAA